ncbi:hypothetical protein CNR22_06895 [Sphingobacteriaceae bacterium]|nr:hypothetical protein CNR22_06895 [Sphingobacteriaceae bacterium]
MKKFLVNTLVFGLIFLLITFLLDMVKVSDDYMINKTATSSFEKIAWNLDLIKNHSSKIKGSSIFFGPSLTQAGLCDSTLSSNGIPSVNFGINGAGNEVSLFFLRRVIGLKPGKIYLHLFKDGHKDLHKMTPLLYDPVSLLKSGQSINFNFIQFLIKRPYFILDYLGWELMGNKMAAKKYKEYGVVYEPVNFTPQEYTAIRKEKTDEYFESCNLSQTKFIKRSELGRSGLGFKIIRYRRAVLYYLWNSEFTHNCRSQETFVASALALCRKNNLPVCQLYMPLIADAKINRDFDESFFSPGKKESVIALKNFSFLDTVVYWSDMTHLSTQGSKIFTQALIDEKLVKP